MPSPVIATAHRSLGRELFKAPMSHDARQLLEFIVDILNRRGLQPGGKNPLLEAFAKDYTACLYEDAVLGWSFRDVIKKLKTTLTKTKDTPSTLEVARLVPLYNKMWDINVAQGAQFRFSRSVSQTEVYNFLCQEFLLDDFSRTDLLKLSEISRRPLDSLKEICRKLDRPEQRFIAYLARVVSNDEKQQEAITQNTDRALDNSMNRLKDILSAQTDDKRYKVPLDRSWIEDVKITREMDGTDGKY